MYHRAILFILISKPMLITDKKFISLVIIILIAFSSFYYALFSYQVGADVKAEWWLKNLYDYKDHIATQKKSPKIIIISGSNSLFGVDSSIIEDMTKFPVVNLAGHAGLDISFLYLKIKEHMKEGDVIVMPLEFGYFQRTKMTNWFTNNMLAWGKDDYLDQLGYLNLFEFVSSVPKSQIYNGILEYKGKKSILEEEKAIANIESLISKRDENWRGYKYTSLNRFGDMISGDGVTEDILSKSKKGFHYYGGWDISDRFFDYYKKITKIVEDRNGRLIFTWSVTMKNPLFDLLVSKHQARISKILSNLHKESIYLSCAPELFHFDVELFFNTEYHLNKFGTTIRSKNLALCINQTLAENLNH